MKKTVLCGFLSLLACIGGTNMGYAVEPTVALEETFDAFTEGSVDKPAETVDISATGGKLGQTLSGWTGKQVYEAGGALMVGSSDILATGQRYLQTPRMSLSMLSGNVKVTIRLKALAEYGNLVDVLVGYTTLHQVQLFDNEWHDIVFVTDRSISGNVKLQSKLQTSFFIDYIKIEQSSSFLLTPEAFRPTDFDGQSFTASWARVSGVTSYLLDVYSYGKDNVKEYVKHDEEVTGTSVKVTGLDASKKYFFTVRAKKGDDISLYSEEMDIVKRVTSLAAPKVSAATNVTANGFTANWSAVENAEKYIVRLYQTTTLKADEVVNVVSEDFSGITEGTLSSVGYPDGLREYLDNYTKVPGWFAYNHVYAKGFIGLAPFVGDSYVLSPELDLSKDEGAFTVDVKMGEGDYSGSYLAGATVKVALVTIGADEAETVVEEKTVTLDAELKDYSIAFTKGLADGYVKVTYAGSNKLFIDDITISQSYKKGESVKSLLQENTTDGLSLDIKQQMESDSDYSYTVMAMVNTIDGNGEDIELYSPASDEMHVDFVSGVAEAEAAQATVVARGGKILVVLPIDSDIAVYDLSGRLLVKKAGIAGENTIDAPKGMMIVKAGNTVRKVVL